MFLDPRPNPVLAPFVLAALGSPLILSIIDFRRGGNPLVTLLATMVAGLAGLFAVSAAFVPL